ncbi:MAG: ABC transporter ATP-binding protein [Myxococcota bacterium]
MSTSALREPADSLEALLRVLLAATGRSASDASCEAALRVTGPWMERLDSALPAVGLQARWMTGGAEVALREARPDLPLVTWLDDAVGGSWMIVSAQRFGRVQVTALGDGERTQWVDPGVLFGSESRAWARVLPILPATPLGAGEGLPRSPFWRLMALLRAERQDIGVIVVFAVAIGVLSLATPLAIQLLINWLAFGALLQPIVTLGMALLLCLTLVGVLKAAQRHAVEIVQRRIFARTVTDLSARLARVRIESFDRSYGPELANRFFDVLTLQKAANTLLLDGLAAALQAAVGLILLALYHPLLLVFDLVVVGLVAAVLFPLARGAEASAIVESKKKYAVAAWLEEIARHPLAFKFGGAGFAEDRTDRLADAYLEARESHFHVFFRQYVGMQAIAVVLPAALLVMTGWLVLEGQLTLGQLVAAEFIVASALAGVSKFTEKLETVYDLLAGVDKLGALFDLPLERTHGARRTSRTSSASVDLEQVTFGFPGAGTTLGSLDLKVGAGRSVSILGAPGSGKSTLAELLLGARRPTSGVVLRDGIPVESLRPSELYDEAVLVRHDGLFAGSVRENLTLGRSVSDTDLWAVLEALDLHSVVRRLEQGLDTALLPDGAPLSDLQVRGLIVARAIVLEPRLLVIDGVFDGIPAASRERWMAVALDRRAPWTLVLLTADPALAQRCSDILEIREGSLHVRPRLTPV